MFKFLSSFFSGKTPPQPKYFISPHGASVRRIEKLGLAASSENAAHILDPTRLSYVPEISHAEEPKYKGNPDLSWIIEIFPAANGKFSREALWNIFDLDWRKTYYGFELFGRSTEDGQWTYAISGDSPEWFDQLQVTYQLVHRAQPEDMQWNASSLEKFRDALRKRLFKKFTGINIQETEDISSAIKKAQHLAALKQQFNGDKILVLKSPSIFPGLLAWDALTSVGLEWGDGDLFHWNAGDDSLDRLFSVWTSTPPGYFYPEHIKAGASNFDNLIFGFVIARCIDPVNVFDAMVDAAEYCRKRLGGTILNTEGQPFDRQTQKTSLTRMVEDMNAKGIPPGSGLTLRMF